MTNPIIIVDGPEKAGKTTLIRRLAEKIGYRVVKQSGPAKPNFLIYLVQLLDNIGDGGGVIWDRSWASEFVYRTLMGEETPNPVVMEFLMGRIPTLKVMVLGTGDEEQFSMRTSDDMPVNPATERRLFEMYGDAFGWLVFHNSYTETSLETMVRIVSGNASRIAEFYNPEKWTGISPDESSLWLVYDPSDYTFLETFYTPTLFPKIFRYGAHILAEATFVPMTNFDNLIKIAGHRVQEKYLMLYACDQASAKVVMEAGYLPMEILMADDRLVYFDSIGDRKYIEQSVAEAYYIIREGQ